MARWGGNWGEDDEEHEIEENEQEDESPELALVDEIRAEMHEVRALLAKRTDELLDLLCLEGSCDESNPYFVLATAKQALCEALAGTLDGRSATRVMQMMEKAIEAARERTASLKAEVR